MLMTIERQELSWPSIVPRLKDFIGGYVADSVGVLMAKEKVPDPPLVAASMKLFAMASTVALDCKWNHRKIKQQFS